MPENTISIPEHPSSVTRMTLGITSARGEASPSGTCGCCCRYVCSASEGE